MSHKPLQIPVWLGKEGGDRLSIRIAQYEFPRIASDCEYDRNWLRIEGFVERTGSHWRFNEPCMLTHEWQELLDWAKAFPEVPTPKLGFIEPLLTFESVDGCQAHLHVTLRGEAVPETLLPFKDRWSTGISLQIELAPSQLQQAIAVWEEDNRRFEPR